MVIILLVVIGGVVGWLFSTFTEGRGGLGLGASVAAGIVGGLASGLLFGMVGERIVGPGPILIASLLAAALGAFVLLLIIRLVKK